MFDVTVTNPLGPTALARAGTRAGRAIEETVQFKETQVWRHMPRYRQIVPLGPSLSVGTG